MSRKDEQLLQETWPDWEVGEPLGQGSFGEVYALRRKSAYGPDQESAVKIIRVPMDPADVTQRRLQGMSDEDIRAFYRRQVDEISDEIKIMQTLVGAPNIIVVHDYQIAEQDDGISWVICIRMEKLEPLEEYFGRTSLPNERDVARIGVDICGALEACHERSIVHRDVKPANVFHREASDGYVLGDFGIARQVERDSSTKLSQRGTPFYMAPELYHGEHYDTNVDLYSLGIMLYRYLNHMRFPFCPSYPQPLGTNDEEQANRHRLRREPVPALQGVNENLSAIVCKACDPNPRTRYQSATALRADLETWLKHPDRPIASGSQTVRVEELDNRDVGVDETKVHNVMGGVNRTGGGTGSGDGTKTVIMGSGDDPVRRSTQGSGTVKKDKSVPVLVAVCVALFALAIGLGAYLWSLNHPPEPPVEEIYGYLDRAREQADNKEYGAAISILDEGLRAYPDSSKLKEQKETYQNKDAEKKKEEKEIADCRSNATRKANDGDYDGAISVLDEGLAKYPDAQELKDLKETYENSKRREPESGGSTGDTTGGTTGSTPGGTTEEPPGVTPARRFPRNWSGTYLGTTSTADGGEARVERAFTLDLYDVQDDGSISGTVTIDGDEKYSVVGVVDWDGETIYFYGTEWIVQGDLQYMCEFTGNLNSGHTYMSGERSAINTESASQAHPGGWELYAR